MNHAELQFLSNDFPCKKQYEIFWRQMGETGRYGILRLLPAHPPHAAFGGYRQSGIGRENHKMMLDHYQQTKNLLVSYSDKPLGFFWRTGSPGSSHRVMRRSVLFGLCINPGLS